MKTLEQNWDNEDFNFVTRYNYVESACLLFLCFLKCLVAFTAYEIRCLIFPSYMQALKVTEHADTKAKDLSGGTKRKVRLYLNLTDEKRSHKLRFLFLRKLIHTVAF